MMSQTTATSDAPEVLAGPAERGALWTLLSVVVIDLIGFAIVIPVLPFYAESYGASALVLGLLVSSFAGMQFLFSPVWGKLSDRVGRRPVMLWTIAGTALALFALGLADSLVWLFVARIFGGLFGANISVATAYVTDLTAASERTKWMGLIGASFGVGFVLGPALCELFSRWGHGAPALAAAGLAALNFGWAWFRLKEPVRHQAAAGERPSPRAVLADPFVRRLCLLNFLFTFAVSQLETVFAYFMLHRFGYGVGQVARLMVLMAVVMVAVQGGGMRPLAKRFGERRLLVGGSSLLALACATIPLAPTVLLLLVPLVVSSLGRAVAYPSMLSLVSTGAGSANRGAVMGGFQSAAALARVGGPLAAGALYELEPGWPFLLAAGLLAVVAALPTLTLESRLTVAAPAAGSGIISPAANAAPSDPAR